MKNNLIVILILRRSGARAQGGSKITIRNKIKTDAFYTAAL